MSTLIFFFLWHIRDRERPAGQLFMIWLALAGLERFIVEFFRAKDDRFLAGFTVAQLISLLIVAVGVAGALRVRARRAPRAATA
jgi:phosphatidylglycerol:prolipoprotein diacylglycerol transferase